MTRGLFPSSLTISRGLDGQFVIVIPYHDLVVVRMGLTLNYMIKWDHQKFVGTIIEALD